MKKRYTEGQIVYALKQAELGEKVTEICRKMGVAEATFYTWRKKYRGMGVSELRRMKELEEENRRLKGLGGKRVNGDSHRLVPPPPAASPSVASIPPTPSAPSTFSSQTFTYPAPACWPSSPPSQAPTSSSTPTATPSTKNSTSTPTATRC